MSWKVKHVLGWEARPERETRPALLQAHQPSDSTNGVVSLGCDSLYLRATRWQVSEAQSQPYTHPLAPSSRHP